MRFPTPEEVESADQLQLCKWMRFLQLPYAVRWGRRGGKKLSPEEFLAREDDIKRWTKIMDRIMERFSVNGGWTQELSKSIGWEATNHE